MPYMALVVDDPDKHHAAAIARQAAHELPEIQKTMRAEVRARGAKVSAIDDARSANTAARVAREKVGPKALVGDLHTVCARECPNGLPNCEHCGDPAHATACKAAGHCPHCGTRHGIAPASYLASSGVVLQELEIPGFDEVGKVKGRAFMADHPAHPFLPEDLEAERHAVVKTFLETHLWDRQTRRFIAKG